MLPEAFHQVSAKEDLWLERRCWLKNPRWWFSDWPFLTCEWGDCSYSESLCCLTHPTKILIKRRYGLEEMFFKEQQDGC